MASVSLSTRLRHFRLALACLPGLLLRPSHRRRLAEMRALCRQLPDLLEQPLPQAMLLLTPSSASGQPPIDETTTRRLADLAAVLERNVSLGHCLRRSLIRYHYLRQLGLPVTVKFGARKESDARDEEIVGHAWLTLADTPYHEDEAHWRGFTPIVSWPGSE